MKIIALEGPDKVGKQTQTALLVKALRAFGLSVESVEIPFADGDTYTKIYEMLADGSALQYPQVFQTFQAANRMAWQKYTLPALAHHDVLIMDRWNASSWVYGRAAGLSDECLSCILSRVMDIDATFVLDGEAMSAPSDSYEANKPFMLRVRTEYQRWAAEQGAIVLDANRPREVVAEELLGHCHRWI